MVKGLQWVQMFALTQQGSLTKQEAYEELNDFSTNTRLKDTETLLTLTSGLILNKSFHTFQVQLKIVYFRFHLTICAKERSQDIHKQNETPKHAKCEQDTVLESRT
jgi:hypothetical protein